MKRFDSHSKRMQLAYYITHIFSAMLKTLCLGILIIILTWIGKEWLENIAIASDGPGPFPPTDLRILEDSTNVNQHPAKGLILPRHINAAVPDLIKDLKDKEWNVRFSSLKILIEKGPEAKAAVPSLIEVFKDKSEDKIIRGNAAFALLRMKPESKIAIPAFIEVLKDKHEYEDLRMAVINYLGEMKPESVLAVRDLIILFKDKNESKNMRHITAYTLNEIGPEAKAILPDLVEVFKDKDEDISFRRAAAEVLGKFGPKAKAAVLDLIEVLTDKKEQGSVAQKESENIIFLDKGPRALAAFVLGEIGPEAKEAVPILIKLFRNKSEITDVRTASALALAKIEGKMVLLDLVEALKDKNEVMRVRDGVASALGKIGSAAKAIIPTLIEILNDENENKIIRETIGGSLVKIAEKLQDTEDTESIPELEKARNAFVTGGFKVYAEELNRSIHALRAIKRAKMWNSVRDWIGQNRWMFGPLIYITLALLFSLALLFVRPLWLLKINDSLKPYTDFKLPDWLGGIKVPVRYILMIGFFHYHMRVLDAWIAQHISVVQEAFQGKLTVRNRNIHVPMPVILDGKPIASLVAEDLRLIFVNKRGVLLIWGEGGAGKTSLACQIAKWAMSEDNTTRLSKDHLMLPVLIEYDLDIEGINDKDAFSEAIRGQLRSQIGGGYPLSKELVYHLLIRRRILVILDGLSELSEATRKVVRPADPDFPVNTLIITSRIDEKLDGVPKVTIKPLRIHGDRLSTFMAAYLVQLDKQELFDDTEYFDACRRLSSIVGSRDITPLLAKIYADQLITSKEGKTEHELPDNIPDLMLSYLNELNRGAQKDDPDDRTVHRAAKTVAWECLKNTYRPTPARRSNILAALGKKDNVEVILNYLEDRLRLVQTIGSGRDLIKFTLDPLAEYLAGSYMVDHLGDQEKSWREFFLQVDKMPSGPDAIRGFLLALLDCCTAKRNEGRIPNFALEDLARRINLKSNAS